MANSSKRIEKILEKRAKPVIQSETDLARSFVSWLLQAKGTCFICFLVLGVFLWSQTLTESQFNSLIFTPESLLALNFVPMISSWFLHADLAHMIGNLIFLFIFGRVVERVYGTTRMLMIFFSSAIMSDIIAGLIFNQGGIGASGAISGIIGAAILNEPFYLNYTFFGLPLPIVIIGWLGIFADISGLLNPLPQDNIGHIAHLTGFFAMSLWLYATSKDKNKIQTGLVINILTMVGAIIFYTMYPETSFRDVVTTFLQSLTGIGK